VGDTGPGIPLDEQERIFTPFYRGNQISSDIWASHFIIGSGDSLDQASVGRVLRMAPSILVGVKLTSISRNIHLKRSTILPEQMKPGLTCKMLLIFYVLPPNITTWGRVSHAGCS
jgi:hypothetical protein